MVGLSALALSLSVIASAKCQKERGDGMVNFGVACNGRDARWLRNHGSPFMPNHRASVVRDSFVLQT
ncbi:MAG: hypothetical protein QOJ15_2659 [Bradyrhizobium sp.]|jgi:hypothetical protein|nr:hypothetical protein [Bradyrhizobium sp.]